MHRAWSEAIRTAVLVAMVLVGLAVLASVAVAQPADAGGGALPDIVDAGALASSQGAPSANPTPVEPDPGEVADEAFRALERGAPLAAFGGALILIAYVVRRIGTVLQQMAREYKRGRSDLGPPPFFLTKAGGYVASGIAAAALTIGTALAAGKPPTGELLVAGATAMWVASGGYDTLREAAAAIERRRGRHERRDGQRDSRPENPGDG